MKKFKIILRTVLLLSLIFLTNSNSGCQDPDEYAPYEDSLIPPPAAPQPLSPPDDTGYVYIPGLGPVAVEFEWTQVQDAEYYELHVSNDSTYTDTAIYKVAYNSVVVAFVPRRVYWRVRASSSRWTWFTDWSETWYLRIWQPVE